MKSDDRPKNQNQKPDEKESAAENTQEEVEEIDINTQQIKSKAISHKNVPESQNAHHLNQSLASTNSSALHAN